MLRSYRVYEMIISHQDSCYVPCVILLFKNLMIVVPIVRDRRRGTRHAAGHYFVIYETGFVCKGMLAHFLPTRPWGGKVVCSRPSLRGPSPSWRPAHAWSMRTEELLVALSRQEGNDCDGDCRSERRYVMTRKLLSVCALGYTPKCLGLH